MITKREISRLQENQRHQYQNKIIQLNDEYDTLRVDMEHFMSTWTMMIMIMMMMMMIIVVETKEFLAESIVLSV